MKNKFVIKDSVITPAGPGTVRASAPFADHIEYLVVFADGTGTWLHESKLSPAPVKQQLTNK